VVNDWNADLTLVYRVCPQNDCPNKYTKEGITQDYVHLILNFYVHFYNTLFSTLREFLREIASIISYHASYMKISLISAF